MVKTYKVEFTEEELAMWNENVKRAVTDVVSYCSTHNNPAYAVDGTGHPTLHYWQTHVTNAVNLPFGIETKKLENTPKPAIQQVVVVDEKGIVKQIIETPITFGVSIGSKVLDGVKKIGSTLLHGAKMVPDAPPEEKPKEEG
jgi:hypothetical protein